MLSCATAHHVPSRGRPAQGRLPSCLTRAHTACADGHVVGALQSPLQPLQDNLESTTYETFERDGQKYSQYQLAVEAALRDRVPDSQASFREVLLPPRGRSPFSHVLSHAPSTPSLCSSHKPLSPYES